MSCYYCSYKEITKPPQRSLSNLDYLDLLSQIDEIKAHAKRVHEKELWKCKYLLHDWRKIIDRDYDTHAICHRCAKYKPVAYSRSYD
jgi:hypothetical protein